MPGDRSAQRPNMAWAADYDPWVKWVHMAYHAFFHEAETPEEFVKFFEDKKLGVKTLKAFYEGHEKETEVVYVYKKAQHKTR